MSEPPSSDANGTFLYTYILCVICVRRAAYPKLIQFNARNVYKIRIVQTPMESYSNSSARVPEPSGNREDRLQRRRERERTRRASETAEQREERLRVRRARDRARRAAQTAEERDARLRQIRDNRRQSLATESEEERAVRLQQMRDRLASETDPNQLHQNTLRIHRIRAHARPHNAVHSPSYTYVPLRIVIIF